MEDINLDLLKALKHDRVITDEEYSSKILSFAQEYLTKDTKLDILGIVEKGTYGGVFAAKEPGAWEELSVEVVSSEKCNRPEAEDWSSFKHPNILRLLYKQYIPQIDAYAFMTELHTYTLETYLDDKWFKMHKNAPLIVKKFLKEILEGLDYLHKRNYSHMNLTAGNVWISKDYKAVLTNFSFLNWLEEISTEMEALQGGPPETCKHFKKNSSLALQGDFYDIWSYGILALNIFTKNYVRKKTPKLITSWCDSLYPVIFKILQKNIFKEYTKKAFPSSKIDKQTRGMMLNFIVTCLRIFPEERPAADRLFQHKYFQTDGFLFAGEDAWDRKVKIKTLWKPKPSTARIIQAKKQSLRKTVESLSKGDECKEFSYSENKAQIANSIDRSKQIFIQDDDCEMRVSAESPNQSTIKEVAINTNTIEPISKYLEPNVLFELNEILQKERDITEKSTIEESASNSNVVEPISKYLEPKVFHELNEILQKESDLTKNAGTYGTFAGTDFEETLKPMLLKVPTDTNSIDDMKPEEMPDDEQFKYNVQRSCSKLSNGFRINDKIAVSKHQEKTRYRAEDFTKLEWGAWKNKNFPCLSSVELSHSEGQICTQKKEESFKTKNSKSRTKKEPVTDTSRLTNVTDHLSRPLQSMASAKASDFELFPVRSTKKEHCVNLKDRKLKEVVVSQTSKSCPDKMTIFETSETSQVKKIVVSSCPGEFVDEDMVDASIPVSQHSEVSQDI